MIFARIHLTLTRFSRALRTYWLRIVLGAVCGWFAASLLGAFGLIALEEIHVVNSDEVAALLAAVIGWSGVGLGALVAYSMRPARASSRS